MSSNKFKYYNVETTESHVVKANSVGDAKKLARGRRGVSGKVLVGTEDVNVKRISATVAHDLENS